MRERPLETEITKDALDVQVESDIPQNLERVPKILSIHEQDFASIAPMYGLPDAPPITWDQFKRLEQSHAAILSRLIQDVESAIGSDSLHLQSEAAKLIRLIPNENDRLRLQTLLSPIVRYQISRTDVPPKRDSLNDDLSPIEEAMNMIPYVPVSDRESLVRIALSSTDEHIQWLGSTMIRYVDPVHKEVLKKEWEEKTGREYEEAQDNPSWYESGIEQLPETERIAEIQALLTSGFGMTDEVDPAIDSLSPEKQSELRDAIFETAISAIREGNVRFSWLINIIPYTPETKRLGLIHEILTKATDLKTRHQVLKQAKSLNLEDRDSLNKTLLEGKESFFKNLATKTPLYDKTPNRFRKWDFLKDGSFTTLLDKVPQGESLKGRAIIRTIPEISYLAWVEAFSAYEIWKARGFEYVPIEQIIRAKRTDRPLRIDVATQVLGPAAGTWIKAGGPFAGEILEQIDKIKETLNELGVNHGHLHEYNFCLYFYKSEDGDVDLTRPPRVYCIDFDQSLSKKMISAD